MMEEQIQDQQPAETATASAGVEAGEGDTPETSVVALEQRIAELERQVEEHKDNWMRAAADFRNLKRRTEQERADLIRSAGAGVILKLLPVLDDIERAMTHVPEAISSDPWFEGLRLVSRKLHAILEGEGVRPIEALGADFDPTQHEAVMYAESTADAAGKVIEELQRGYKIGDRVLRPTMVKVGQG